MVISDHPCLEGKGPDPQTFSWVKNCLCMVPYGNMSDSDPGKFWLLCEKPRKYIYNKIIHARWMLLRSFLSREAQWRKWCHCSCCEKIPNMPPVRIKHVVSFSSQDQKYPVEGLLSEDSAHPWLCSMQDRGRQLKADLQLEWASYIGYIDVGNCGSAFIQIEVARSSWPLDKPYVMLLPSTTLMTPADSKLAKNRTGVRMFKEGDFLQPAATEKWDRIRVTCSQPFNKHAQFGLSFIQIRTPLDDGSECAALNVNQHHSQCLSGKSELSSSPWLSNPAIQRTFFTEAQAESPSEQQLKNRLHQIDPNSASRLGNQVCLSRTAKMVISAAQSRSSRNFPFQSGGSPASRKKPSGVTENAENLSNHNNYCTTGSVNSATLVTSQVSTAESQSKKRCWPNKSTARSPASVSRGASLKKKRQDPFKPQSEALTCKLQDTSRDDDKASHCPVCGVLFTNSYLPLHASRCGDNYGGIEEISEDEEPIIIDVCSSSRDHSTLVPCPLCGLYFSVIEIERHASTCGESCYAC